MRDQPNGLCAAFFLGLVLVLTSTVAQPSAGAQSTSERLEVSRNRVGQLKTDAERIANARALSERRLNDTTIEIADTKAVIDRIGNEMTAARITLEARIRTAYKMGGIGLYAVLLEARSLREFSIRLTSLTRQTLRDEKLILGLRNARSELELRRDRLDRQQLDLESRTRSYEAESGRLSETLEQANRTIQELTDQRSREELARTFTIKTPKASSDQPREPTASESPDATSPEADDTTVEPPSGRVVPMASCPVDPPRAVSDSFGAPRDGGRGHAGNDIMAPRGVAIRAVNAGTIGWTGNGGSGGVSFYLSDGSNEYYYAHLDTLSVTTGQKVAAGQIVGTNGNSGNASGGPTHLHFEIHPGGGEAIDPYPTLSAAC